MRRLFIFLLLIGLISTATSTAQAQGISTTICPGAGCTDINVAGQGSVGIQVTGTWVGTITFSGSVDNNTFTAIVLTPVAGGTAVSTATANGLWTGAVAGLGTVRIAFTAYTSGSAVVSRRTAQAKASTSSGGSGSVTNIATTSPVTGGPITTTGTIACATCAVTGTALSQFAATTSAQLAGIISDETGSGALAFATSPTLVTPTINGLVYPAADGTAGQFVSTNGTGTLSFTTPAATVVNNIKFNNGKGNQTDINTNDTFTASAYDVDGAAYKTFMTLTAANTPTMDVSAPAGGTLSGNFTTLKVGGVDVSTGGGGALSGITAATGTNTIASGNNHSQIWNWALTSNSISAHTLGETTAATGGGTDTQSIFALNTLATSTAVPLIVNNFGAKNSIRINDVSGDTTPFVIDADSNVCIHVATCTSSDLTIAETTSNRAITITAGATTGIIDASFDASCSFCFGTTSNNTAGLVSNNASWLITNGVGRISLGRSGSTTISNANMILALDGTSFTLNEYRLIGMGYKASQTHLPVAAGTQLVANTGNRGLWDFVVLTSSSNTDIAPVVNLRVDNQGTLVLPSTTPTPAVSNTSANSCGTSAATIAGNNNIGTVTVGATSGTSCTLTFTTTAPVEWLCVGSNQTTLANVVNAAPLSTTTAKLVGTFVAGDKITYHCFPR